MALVIKDISSPELDINSLDKNHIPFDDKLCFLLELDIGDNTSPGTDLFSVVICSPVIRKTLRPKTKAYVVTNDTFNWNTIINELKSIVIKCDSSQWEECITKLRQYFNWEYE